MTRALIIPGLLLKRFDSVGDIISVVGDVMCQAIWQRCLRVEVVCTVVTPCVHRRVLWDTLPVQQPDDVFG